MPHAKQPTGPALISFAWFGRRGGLALSFESQSDDDESASLKQSLDSASTSLPLQGQTTSTAAAGVTLDCRRVDTQRKTTQ